MILVQNLTRIGGRRLGLQSRKSQGHPLSLIERLWHACTCTHTHTHTHIIINSLLHTHTFIIYRASFIAGLLGTTATNPIDVVKSRMMNQAVTKPTTLVRAPIATPTGAVLAATSIPATGPVLTTRTHVYKSSLDCFFTVS